MEQTDDTRKVLLALLDTPIAFHRVFVKIGGGATAGLLLSQAFYWSKNRAARARDGWFYKSAAEWEEETGLTRREQETARRHLRERGLLEEQIGVLKDEGRVLWFRVNIDALCAALESGSAEPAPEKVSRSSQYTPEGSHESAGGVAQKRQTPSHETARPVAQKRQTSLITSETTTETTAKNTHTRGALALAPTPASATAPSADAGVSVNSSKSLFSFEERKAHADRNGLGPGWLNFSRDGRYDDLIADELARTSPEAVERALATPARTLKSYGAALLHVRSVVSLGGAGSEPAGEIERLFESGKIDEATRERLLARDWTADVAAPASAGGRVA
jgi:hypothetical protein